VAAIITVLLISAFCCALSLLLPKPIGVIRPIVAGLSTWLLLRSLGDWIGDYYLGGAAHVDPWAVGRLMSEGWGMMNDLLMFPLVGIVMGVFYFIAFMGSTANAEKT
jgi:hypothetical protein